ncbi:restriction endonuclease, partial [Myxococcota bacterium]|nr:restriction endonuclease [Myxococcota bacterium]
DNSNDHDPDGAPDDTNYLDVPDGDPGHGKDRPAKYYVHNVEVRVATERVQYLDEHGKLITESLRDYTRRTLRAAYTTLDAFLTVWNDADRKKAILDELAEKGVFLDELAAMVGREYDAFDLICHVAWDRPPLTRSERADGVRKRDAFARYGEQARAVLDALLLKYADTGILAIDTIDVLRVDPIARLGTPMEITQWFGGKDAYLAAVRQLELALYPKAA